MPQPTNKAKLNRLRDAVLAPITLSMPTSAVSSHRRSRPRKYSRQLGSGQCIGGVCQTQLTQLLGVGDGALGFVMVALMMFTGRCDGSDHGHPRLMSDGSGNLA